VVEIYRDCPGISGAKGRDERPGLKRSTDQGRYPTQGLLPGTAFCQVTQCPINDLLWDSRERTWSRKSALRQRRAKARRTWPMWSKAQSTGCTALASGTTHPINDPNPHTAMSCRRERSGGMLSFGRRDKAKRNQGLAQVLSLHPVKQGCRRDWDGPARISYPQRLS
jgi:hypothetical protein